MRSTTPLFATLLLISAALLVSPAAAEAQITCASCDCTTSCSTTCTYQVPGDPNCVRTPDNPCPPFETEYGTCGNDGPECSGDPGCGGGGGGGQDCSDPNCTTYVNLTSGNDTFNGTSALECIWGNNGNDTIDGNAGDDAIYGGSGTDTLFGDSGNDCLFGQGDADHLDGESGTDVGDGGAGADTCTTATETRISC